MIPESGYRFSEKILSTNKRGRDAGSKESHPALGYTAHRICLDGVRPMTISNSPSAQADISAPKAAVWRWRVFLVALAFLFAAADFAIVAFVQLYPESTIGATYLRLWGRAASEIRPFADSDLTLYLTLVALWALEFNWPFFVLAARTRRIFLRHWPDVAAGRAALIGGTIGLSIAYVFWDGFLSPSVLIPLVQETSPDRGESLLAVLLIWPASGLLAYFGLRIGPVLFLPI